MIALDTNVVVRLLVDDDAAQCQRARRFVEAVEAADEMLWLSDVVLCETVWVLESCYRLPREAIARALARLIRARQIMIASSDQVAAALVRYAEGPADFADYVILEQSKAAGCEKLVTFDRELLTLPGVSEP